MRRPLQWTALVPAYNASHVLADALESLRYQVTAPARVVVYDDASQDGTGAVAKHFGVELIRGTTNFGVGVARSRLLETVRTPWFLVLDADDMLLAHATEAFTAAVRRYPDAAVLGFAAIEWHGSSFGVAEPLQGGHLRCVSHRDLLRRNPFTSSGSMVSTSAARSAGGYAPLRSIVDYDLWLRMARSQVGNLYIASTPVVARRVGRGTITSNVVNAVLQENELLQREGSLLSAKQLLRRKLILRRLELWLRGYSRHLDYGYQPSSYVPATRLFGQGPAAGLDMLRTRRGASVYSKMRRIVR